MPADGTYRNDGQRFAADVTDNVITPKIILVNADGTPMTGASGLSVTARATAVAPTYTEASDSRLSQTLKGGQRVALIDQAGAELSYTSDVPVQPSLLTVSRLTTALFSQATVADHTVVAGVSGQTIRVHRVIINTAGAVNITIKRASTAISPPLKFTAATTVPKVFEFVYDPWWTTGMGESLVFALSAAVAVDAQIGYTIS